MLPKGRAGTIASFASASFASALVASFVVLVIGHAAISGATAIPLTGSERAQLDGLSEVTPRSSDKQLEAGARPDSDRRAISSMSMTSSGSQATSQIAYECENGPPTLQTSQICIQNADGSGVEKLSDGASFDMFPEISPDGSRIAYVSGRDVWVMASDGSDKQKITSIQGNWNSYNPSWSPDGRFLVYSVDHAGTRDGCGGQKLRVVDLETLTVRDLTSGELCGVLDHYPAWSPDGSTIVYARDVFVIWDVEGQLLGIQTSEIRTILPDGSGDALLFVADGWYRDNFEWSPTGDWIAFQASTNTSTALRGSEIRVIRSDGTQETRLSDSFVDDRSNPTWSPNGAEIAFRGGAFGAPYGIWIMPFPTELSTTLTENGVVESFQSQSFSGGRKLVDSGSAPSWGPYIGGSVPSTPVAPTVTRGNAQVTVAWVAPANGGSAITGYTVYTYIGTTLVAGKTCTPSPATALTCTVTGLTNGTAYTFKVKARNAIGSSNSAASTAVTPATVPAAPAAPAVTRGNAQVTVAWVAPANGGSVITGYTVSTYTGTTLVTGKTCTPSPATAKTCVVTGLTNGTAYTFKVKARNAIGSTNSAASVVVTPATVPSAPVAPTVTRGNAQVTVAWVAPANGGSAITGFTVSTYSGTTLVTGKTCTPSPATATTCVVTGLTNGTAYTFKVKARNAIGSTNSAASVVATPATVPSTPAAPTVVKGHLSAQLTWVAPSNGGSAITGYTVYTYIGTTLVAGKTCTPSPATALTCTVTGLTNGTAYTFKVKARNAIGSTNSAASVAATPAAVPATPAAPTVTVGPAIGTGKATIKWVAPANNGSAITGFTARAYTAAGVSSGTCTTASATALSCSITGLSNGTTYTFKVTAKNANGTSFQSPGATGRPSAT